MWQRLPAGCVDWDVCIVCGSNFAKMLLCQFAEFVVLDAAGACQDHSRSLVVGPDVVDKVVTGQRLDIFGWAQDGASQGSSLVGNCVQVVEHHLLQIHLNLLHLSKNHTALPLNFLQMNIRSVTSVYYEFLSKIYQTYLFTKLGVLEDI